EIIKARLKALFPKANLPTKRIDALAAKLAQMPADDADDAAVDVILNQANDFNSFEEIAKEDDRVRTLEAKVKETTPLPPAPGDPKPNDPPKPDDVNAKLLEAITKLTGEVEAIKTGKIAETKIQTAIKLFDGSEILKGLKPELKQQWIKRVDPNSEITIEDQVKSLETEYSDIKQSFADSTQHSGPTPFRSGGKNEPSAEEIKEIMDEIIPN
ncbi:MAG: hypothetical protein CVU01_02870, partial [Bacteroidetes bacterium HGW-Bacteroidetes-18]